MDSFELNKILGAILATCILVLVTSFAANAVFTPKPLEKPGFSSGFGVNTALAAKLVTRTRMQVARIAPRILLSSKESIVDQAPSRKVR